MPYFYKRKWRRPRTYYRNKYNQRRWRFRPRRRRARKAFRRHRKYRVRKFRNFFKRKLKFLPLKQWQPERIRKCKIKGLFTLFNGAQGRFANNWPQYRDSFTPEFTPSGGGWGIFVFNLGALFEEFLRVRNWWTVSNVDLPLCRYTGCKLRFYRTDYVDYVVQYTLSYPMTDTQLLHAESCPARMLLSNHKIIVTRRENRKQKPYITKRLKPPKQLVNKWFFQRDFFNTNLLMLKATACDLHQYDINKQDYSNNITLQSLSYYNFPHLNYDTNITTGWTPKAGKYLWATRTVPSNNPANPLNGITYESIIYLGQATRMVRGTPFGEATIPNTDNDFQKKWRAYTTDPKYWGNIFYSEYLKREATILVSNKQPTGIREPSKPQDLISSTDFTIMIEPITEAIRYNPEIDTGKDTEIFLVPNFQQQLDWTQSNELLKFHGFPLWMLLWGWIDWQKKLAAVNQIDDHYILIVKSPYMLPKRPFYMFLDEAFIENESQFPNPHDHDKLPPLHYETTWFPKVYYQLKSIDKICMSGPATPKANFITSIQSHMEYIFSFKWGGSPSTMETIADPSKQISYATPSNLQTGLQIQNPISDPTFNIYSWDYRRHFLTQKCIERITKDRDTDQSVFQPTAILFNPRPPEKTEKELLQTLIEAQTSEEEKENKIRIYNQLRERQLQLQHRIRELIINTVKL